MSLRAGITDEKSPTDYGLRIFKGVPMTLRIGIVDDKRRPGPFHPSSFILHPFSKEPNHAGEL